MIENKKLKKNLFPSKAHIVFDGNKFFGIYDKDFDQYIKENNNIEIWETWSEWNDNMNKTIQKYNDDLY